MRLCVLPEKCLRVAGSGEGTIHIEYMYKCMQVP